MIRYDACFPYPCLHELGLIPADQEHSDYYPLTREEVAYLLSLAAEAGQQGNYGVVSAIQARFVQGILGIVCPHPECGKVAEVMYQLERYYMENYRRGTDPEVVFTCYMLMNALS